MSESGESELRPGTNVDISERKTEASGHRDVTLKPIWDVKMKANKHLRRKCLQPDIWRRSLQSYRITKCVLDACTIIIEYIGVPFYGHLLNKDTRLLRTVLFVVPTKVHIFSLILVRLIQRTLFCDQSVTLSYKVDRFMDTGYLPNVVFSFSRPLCYCNLLKNKIFLQVSVILLKLLIILSLFNRQDNINSA